MDQAQPVAMVSVPADLLRESLKAARYYGFEIEVSEESLRQLVRWLINTNGHFANGFADELMKLGGGNDKDGDRNNADADTRSLLDLMDSGRSSGGPSD